MSSQASGYEEVLEWVYRLEVGYREYLEASERLDLLFDLAYERILRRADLDSIYEAVGELCNALEEAR